MNTFVPFSEGISASTHFQSQGNVHHMGIRPTPGSTMVSDDTQPSRAGKRVLRTSEATPHHPTSRDGDFVEAMHYAGSSCRVNQPFRGTSTEYSTFNHNHMAHQSFDLDVVKSRSKMPFITKVLYYAKRTCFTSSSSLRLKTPRRKSVAFHRQVYGAMLVIVIGVPLK